MKTSLVALTLGASLLAAGCIGGGDDGTRRGRTASRARFSLGRKNADMAARNQPGSAMQELNNLSPEASMSRDLKKLRESEREQERTLSQMRGSLDKTSEQVRREEEKLQDIRNRIQSYDSAIQRYEMASASAPVRDFGAPPASAAPTDTAGGRRTVSAGYMSRGDELWDYSRDPGQGSYGTAAFDGAGGRPVFGSQSFDASYGDTANRLAAYEQSRGGVAEGEQVIYSGGPGGFVDASYNSAPASPSSSYADMPGLPNWERKVITEPGSVAPAAQNAASSGKAFGGAPVGRPNRAAKVDTFELPPSPFGGGSGKKPEVRDYPGMANGLYEAGDDWPDAARFAQQQPRQAEPARKQPAAPAKTPAAPAKKAPEPEAPAAMDDEVFVPDLYLSGR